MKLDNLETHQQIKQSIQERVLDKEVVIRPGDNIGNIFSKNIKEHQEELKAFNGKLNKMIRNNKGVDRGKSYNPYLDTLEELDNIKFPEPPPIAPRTIELPKIKLSKWEKIILYVKNLLTRN